MKVKTRAELPGAEKPRPAEAPRADPMAAIAHALSVLSQQSANAMHAITTLADGQVSTHAELLALGASRIPPKRLDCEIERDEKGRMKKVVIIPIR